MSAEDYKKISFGFRPDIIFIDCTCWTAWRQLRLQIWSGIIICS